MVGGSLDRSGTSEGRSRDDRGMSLGGFLSMIARARDRTTPRRRPWLIGVDVSIGDFRTRLAPWSDRTLTQERERGLVRQVSGVRSWRRVW